MEILWRYALTLMEYYFTIFPVHRILYTAAKAPEAHLIKGLLEQSDIEVSLAGESLTIGIGGLPIDAAQVEVKVNEDQFEEAVKNCKRLRR